MQSFIKEDKKLGKKIKGINKNVVKKIKRETFINIIFEKQIRQEIKRIETKSDQIVTYNTNKISLVCFDDMMELKLKYRHKDVQVSFNQY